MVLAACLGAVAGILGFLPLYGALRAVKRVSSTSNLSYATLLILAVVVSTIVLIGAVAICAFVDESKAIVFSVAEAAGLIVSAFVFGLRMKQRM